MSQFSTKNFAQYLLIFFPAIAADICIHCQVDSSANRGLPFPLNRVCSANFSELLYRVQLTVCGKPNRNQGQFFARPALEIPIRIEVHFRVFRDARNAHSIFSGSGAANRPAVRGSKPDIPWSEQEHS
jgi:hypothetical protein